MVPKRVAHKINRGIPPIENGKMSNGPAKVAENGRIMLTTN
jgi:hypothetical protein